MKHFLLLLRHELKSLFLSSSTYIAGFLFLALMALLYMTMLAEFRAGPQEMKPNEMFFSLFWLPVWFLVPLITMRSIAEERRQKTLETLMTTPVSAGQVVLAKYGAAYLLYCFFWAFTLLFPVLTTLMLDDVVAKEHLLESGSLIGSYTFVAVSGLLFVAVGIFTSSLTKTQLVAGMLSFSVLFIITVGASLLQSQTFGLAEEFAGPLEYLKIFKHLEDFSRGVIDTRPFLFYISNAGLLVGLSTLFVESKV